MNPQAEPLFDQLDERKQRIVRLFQEAFALTDEQVDGALLRHGRDGGYLTRSFELEGLLAPQDLPVAMAVEAETEAVDLDSLVIEPEVATLLDGASAERFQALPIGIEGGAVVVAVTNPFDVDAIAAIKAKLGRPVRIAVASEDALARALTAFSGQSEHPTIRFSGLDSSSLDGTVLLKGGRPVRASGSERATEAKNGGRRAPSGRLAASAEADSGTDDRHSEGNGIPTAARFKELESLVAMLHGEVSRLQRRLDRLEGRLGR